MDYERKNRWIRYRHMKCKMYLRNDFQHECAYCRLKERDTGVLNEEFFQKDHFIAKNSGAEIDLDAYDNMVYACEKCNRTKSDHDIGQILNPCRDDIYRGENPHVISSGESEQYQLIGRTPEGKQYIEALQLNSNFYREIRKQQEEEARSDAELKQIVAELKERADIPNDSLNKLTELLEKRFSLQMNYLQSTEFLCGKSKAGYAFQNVLKELAKRSIPYELLFSENDLDVAIQHQGTRYLCEIMLNNQNMVPVKRISPQQKKIECWIKENGNYGILYYYMKTGRLDFYQLDRESGAFKFCVSISES